MLEEQFEGRFHRIEFSKSFVGDILLINATEGTQSSAVHQNRLWPDAKIPYIISEFGSI